MKSQRQFPSNINIKLRKHHLFTDTIRAAICVKKQTAIPKLTRELTAMSRIMTLVPFVYRKFFPLGSPFNTVGAPLTVLGKGENIAPENRKRVKSNRSV